MANKNLFVFFVIGICLMGIVSAQSPETGGEGEPVQTGQETGNGTVAAAETQNQGAESQVQTTSQVGDGTGEQVQTQSQDRVQVKTGTYSTESGQQVQVQTQANNMVQLKSEGVAAETKMLMTQQQTQEGTKLQVQLSNGKNAEVKVMPDTAAEKAMEQLRLKNCVAEEGCSIELKEVGQGEQTKAAYEIKAQKQVKVLGLFRAKMNVEAQVDAENGQVIRTKKQWWAFLATDAEEADDNIVGLAGGQNENYYGEDGDQPGVGVDTVDSPGDSSAEDSTGDRTRFKDE